MSSIFKPLMVYPYTMLVPAHYLIVRINWQQTQTTQQQTKHTPTI